MVLRIGKINYNRVLYNTTRNAILIRLLVLAVIAFSGEWEISFIGEGIADDWKYEQGAVLYEQNADDLFDVNTFTQIYLSLDEKDGTGYYLSKPISHATLWYLITCFLVWIFKTKYAIRLFNIFLVAFSMKYIYNFAEKIWGESVAKTSIKLYAYLPYPVIFCCFGFKEELVLYCTFFLLSNAVDIRKNKKKNTFDYIKMFFVAILMLGIRSGISLVLIGLCFAIMVLNKPLKGKQDSFKRFCFILMIIIVSVFAIVYLGNTIVYKASIYMGESWFEMSNSSGLMIRGLGDIWKLPLSYLFSILMPIDIFAKPTSWMTLVDNFNICLIPISVGALMYMLFIKKIMLGKIYMM